MSILRDRISRFCLRYHLDVPILLAPMAGACPPSLSIAVANAGGMGACGALLMSPSEIIEWATEVRAQARDLFQINLWVPDPKPLRDASHEAQIRAFLSDWGPQVPIEAGDAQPLDFAEQCEALLAIKPVAVSSIMGLFPPDFVAQLKSREIAWFATATTVEEARAAQLAGADAIIAQGMEAGGHRGCFDESIAETQMVGLFALLPAIANAVTVPVIATGGIADARGVAAAFVLGASAVSIGTGFLRTPEAKIHPAWAQLLEQTSPEQTVVSRVFSGRAGRSIATDYVRAALDNNAPKPAPYPVQRSLTALMRKAAQQENNAQRMQVWAGQSCAMAQAKPVGDIVHALWEDAKELLV